MGDTPPVQRHNGIVEPWGAPPPEALLPHRTWPGGPAPEPWGPPPPNAPTRYAEQVNEVQNPWESPTPPTPSIDLPEGGGELHAGVVDPWASGHTIRDPWAEEKEPNASPSAIEGITDLWEDDIAEVDEVVALAPTEFVHNEVIDPLLPPVRDTYEPPRTSLAHLHNGLTDPWRPSAINEPPQEEIGFTEVGRGDYILEEIHIIGNQGDEALDAAATITTPIPAYVQYGEDGMISGVELNEVVPNANEIVSRLTSLHRVEITALESNEMIFGSHVVIEPSEDKPGWINVREVPIPETS